MPRLPLVILAALIALAAAGVRSYRDVDRAQHRMGELPGSAGRNSVSTR